MNGKLDYTLTVVRWGDLKEGDTFLVDDQRQGIMEHRVLELFPQIARNTEVVEMRAQSIMTLEVSTLVSLADDEYYRVDHFGARKIPA